MKLGKRHLQVMIFLVVASLAYNIFSFTRKAQTTAAQSADVPLLSTVQPLAEVTRTRPTPSAGAPAIDPMTIAPPPPVDVNAAPVWSRDPFLAPGESREPAAEVAAAPQDPVGPDPVITSILYSKDRKVALVDHRMVRIGDPLGGGLVADIERDAVVIRLPSGNVRRVEMSRWQAAGVVTASRNK